MRKQLQQLEDYLKARVVIKGNSDKLKAEMSSMLKEELLTMAAKIDC